MAPTFGDVDVRVRPSDGEPEGALILNLSLIHI